jgi:hypothetical protein
MSEHVVGAGRRNRRRQPLPNDATNNHLTTTTPQANLAETPVPSLNDDSSSPSAEANIAASSSTLDFM